MLNYKKYDVIIRLHTLNSMCSFVIMSKYLGYLTFYFTFDLIIWEYYEPFCCWVRGADPEMVRKVLYRFLRACSQIYFTTLWFVMVKKLFCFGVYDKSKCLSKLGYKTPQRILTALKSRNANFTFFGSWFIFHSFSVTNLLISPASIFQVCFRISTMAHTVIFKLYM